MLNRRSCLTTAAAAGLGFAVSPLVHAAASGPAGSNRAGLSPAGASRASLPSLPKLKIYIPAGAGGGWDQTGRALGGALQGASLVKEIEYENKGGKGGTIGLADFVQRHATDPNALFVAGFVMVGALALTESDAIKRLSPIARLTGDYMGLCVAPGKGIKSMKDLVRELQRDVASVTFAGGSAGGVDHMLAAMVLRALKLDPSAMKYVATSSGKEAIALLHSGQATVVISGYSELKAGIDDKTMLPLAVSSRKSFFGIPSLREQDVDTELSNWRAVFAPAGISSAQKEVLRKIVVAATESPVWRQALLDNNWVGSLLYGKELGSFIEFQQGIASLVTGMLKLKK
jgi:putative tricarboxylic transport membrane protein